MAEGGGCRVCLKLEAEIHISMACRWVQSAPHPPSKELKDTLYNAAFHDGAHGLHASTGMALVTTGDHSSAKKTLRVSVVENVVSPRSQ